MLFFFNGKAGKNCGMEGERCCFEKGHLHSTGSSHRPHKILDTVHEFHIHSEGPIMRKSVDWKKKLLHFSMLLSHAEVTWIIVKAYSYLNNSRMSPAGWCVTEKYMRNWTSCACNRARDKMDALCIIKFLHLQSNAAKQFHYETFAEANASMRTKLHTNFLQHFSTNSYFCNWFVSSFIMWKIVWIISEWQCRCLIELHFVTLVLCLPGKLHVELMIWQPTRNTQKEVFVNCEERMTVILLKQNW